jgi:hypothetical protein
MTDAILQAGLIQMTRDSLRRNPPPFAADCEHQIVALAVVDFRFDYACTKCGGFRSFSAGLVSGMDPERLWSHDAAGQLALLAQREVSAGA